MKTLLEFILGIISAILAVIVFVALLDWLFGINIDLSALFQTILEHVRSLFAG